MATSKTPSTTTKDPDGPTSYINYDILTNPSFSPYTYANTLILSTNNPTDTPVDLTTPLSKVLFDVQEIDTHIHTLTSRHALEILTHTQTQNDAAQRILNRVEEERKRISEGYARLEKEVLGRYEKAEEARRGAERSSEVLRIGRGVQRVLGLGRQFESIVSESGLGVVAGREDFRAIERATRVILGFRDVMGSKEGGELGKVNLVRTVRGRVFEDGEARVLDWARRVVREFSVSSLMGAGATFKEGEENRARFTTAVHILYLLSPAPRIDGRAMRREDFEPEYLLRALQGYLQTAITSSSGGIARGLGQLPNLDRALLETSSRCQNVFALQALLRNIGTPQHPLLKEESKHEKEDDLDFLDDDEDDDGVTDQITGVTDNLLEQLLHALDTSSLPSYFWRSLASSLSSRVQEIMTRGGVSARALRSNKDAVRDEVRNCVLRGSRMPSSVLGDRAGKEEIVGNWEREAAVMVGSVVGALMR